MGCSISYPGKAVALSDIKLHNSNYYFGISDNIPIISETVPVNMYYNVLDYNTGDLYPDPLAGTEYCPANSKQPVYSPKKINGGNVIRIYKQQDFVENKSFILTYENGDLVFKEVASSEYMPKLGLYAENDPSNFLIYKYDSLYLIGILGTDRFIGIANKVLIPVTQSDQRIASWDIKSSISPVSDTLYSVYPNKTYESDYSSAYYTPSSGDSSSSSSETPSSSSETPAVSLDPIEYTPEDTQEYNPDYSYISDDAPTTTTTNTQTDNTTTGVQNTPVSESTSNTVATGPGASGTINGTTTVSADADSNMNSIITGCVCGIILLILLSVGIYFAVKYFKDKKSDMNVP